MPEGLVPSDTPMRCPQCEAALISDLAVDPGRVAGRVIQRLPYLGKGPRFDTRVQLILWQLRVIDRPIVTEVPGTGLMGFPLFRE